MQSRSIQGLDIQQLSKCVSEHCVCAGCVSIVCEYTIQSTDCKVCIL